MISEENAKESSDISTRTKLKKYDEYGFRKLQCEVLVKSIFSNNYYTQKNEDLALKNFIETLDITLNPKDYVSNKENKKSNKTLDDEFFQTKLSQIDFSDKSFIFLRLPDVIGPFDESFRVWSYLEWIKNSHVHPVEFEKVDTVRKLSFVARDDVNETILNLIFNFPPEKTRSLLNNAYNLAFDEIITLKEFVDVLFFLLAEKNSALVSKGYFYFVTDDWAKTYLPSVTCGPVSNAKAKHCGLFQKRKEFVDYLRETVAFFEEEANKHEKEFSEMVSDLPKELRSFYCSI